MSRADSVAVAVQAGLREFRCPRCGKLLAKYRFGTGVLEVYCRRCKAVAVIGTST